ncbi:MAG: aminotransferase class V-fold PLP-dependent enzyme, partial [Lachnospiraceae bacterium]|nr:aminotransferase class V-fold PLP-dependent enzyme [Lachnospiraceae bacterium]
KKLGIDLMSVSSHKIHGPKGIGFLYVGERVKMLPITYGGGQQKNMRSGTENVPGIAGMTLAAEKMYENLETDVNRLYELKEYFIKGVTRIEGIQVNGLIPDAEDLRGTAPHVVSVSVAGVRSEVLLHALEDKGIYISAGSACASNKPQTSETLKAIGLQKEFWESTIRFSFSVFTTKEEIDYTLNVMYDMIPMLRKYTRRK